MLTHTTSSLGEIIATLPSLAHQHARTTDTYAALAAETDTLLATSSLRDPKGVPTALGTFGDITLPYTRMGAVDSLALFGVDELIIFAFYAANRNRYRTAADIGANIGLHSIMMARCGWQVKAYEPDPHHADLLRHHLSLNAVSNVELIEAAVSDAPGMLEFVRVLGNTTSSHLAGAKSSAYGELQRFPVRVEPIAAIMPAVDFIKMDAEGQERTIILATTAAHWAHTDMMVEVGTPENAQAIFKHLSGLGVHAYAQKLGWGRVGQVDDMPTSYRDGSLFISRLASMPW